MFTEEQVLPTILVLKSLLDTTTHIIVTIDIPYIIDIDIIDTIIVTGGDVIDTTITTIEQLPTI